MRPCVGLMAARPQCAAGRRTLPAMSVPRPNAPRPHANDAPTPALDPPGLTVVSHGLRTMPNWLEMPLPSMPMSGMVVFATTMAPASRSRAIGSEVPVDGASPLWMALPCQRFMPAIW